MAVNSSVPFASDQLEGDPKLRVAEFLMLVSFMVGSEIVVPSAKVGAWTVKVTFDKVLLVGDETVTIGTPYVEGATVEATVEKQGKERKVTIYKYNAKKHYHKKQGHRQPYTKLIVDSINVK